MRTDIIAFFVILGGKAFIVLIISNDTSLRFMYVFFIRLRNFSS